MSDNDQPKSENELTKLIAAKVDELIEEIRPMLKVALTEVGIATLDVVTKETRRQRPNTEVRDDNAKLR